MSDTDFIIGTGIGMLIGGCAIAVVYGESQSPAVETLYADENVEIQRYEG